MFRPIRPKPLMPTLIAICLLVCRVSKPKLEVYSATGHVSYIHLGTTSRSDCALSLFSPAIAPILAHTSGSLRQAQTAAVEPFDLDSCRIGRRSESRREID